MRHAEMFQSHLHTIGNAKMKRDMTSVQASAVAGLEPTDIPVLWTTVIYLQYQ